MLENGNSGHSDSAAHAADRTKTLRTVAIDEEAASLERIEELITQIEGIDYLKGFTNPIEGIAYIKEHQVDLVFLAILMTSIQGIHAARQIEKIESPPAIAFVTRERNYSYDAWQTNAVDYILKPINKKDLERAIGRAQYYLLFRELAEKKNIAHKDILIKCFPSFDVFVDGEIVEFTYGKVKELLAFLVYQQGTWCSIDQIVFSILEEKEEKRAKQYYRTLMYRLKNVLGKYKIEYILETGYGRARIKPLYYTCEYYEYLKGKKELFRGMFMGTYVWAEEANALMVRENMKELQNS